MENTAAPAIQPPAGAYFHLAVTPIWGMQLTGVELELHFGGPPGPLRDRAFQARQVTGTAAQRWLVPGLPGGEDVAVANRVVASSEFQHAVEHHAAAA